MDLVTLNIKTLIKNSIYSQNANFLEQLENVFINLVKRNFNEDNINNIFYDTEITDLHIV